MTENILSLSFLGLSMALSHRRRRNHKSHAKLDILFIVFSICSDIADINTICINFLLSFSQSSTAESVN